jgi:hypothetical protein
LVPLCSLCCVVIAYPRHCDAQITPIYGRA